MEANKRQLEMKLSEEGYTYVFETKGEMGAKPPSKFRRKVWQIVPSVCATLMCLPFGIMLGWPSPNYPTLTKPVDEGESTTDPIALIRITMDQSAMVAGFLMVGNTAATPFSSFKRLGAKYGVLVGATLMTIGWIMMWQSRDIFYLLGSRFLVGAGNGFGTGQLKYYIGEVCQDSLSVFLTKQINLYVFAGLILAFAFGPFVDFRQFSIIASIISVLVLFLTIFLPVPPRELVKSGKIKEAHKLISFLSPHLNPDDELIKIKKKANTVDTDLSYCDVLKKSSLRKNLLIFAVAVFFQQFSGAPATLVYTQMIFASCGCPRPELCALVYIFAFFLANVYGIFCVPNHNKKHVLLFSSVGVSLLIVVQIIVLVENANEKFWNFTSLVVMLLFIVVHTIGLGSVPFSLIPQLFPKEAKKVVVQFFVMFHSMLALTITKIFQVMFDRIGLFAPFCLFLAISTFSIVFVIIFVPNNHKSTKIREVLT
ncbi:probable metabolite transport protein CsbC [Zophobas morio]|uniref:probable metabolite transport protein CsbC n=1 Tax=Zophobas morio TaxID=2755281 RepID=UPI003082B9CA